MVQKSMTQAAESMESQMTELLESKVSELLESQVSELLLDSQVAELTAKIEAS